MDFRIGIVLFTMLLLPFPVSAIACSKPISPLDYGLSEAKTGVERYKALENCHKDAVKKNANISYWGIKSLDIEIPADAASIPLPDEVDFAGVQLNVLNTQKNFVLFVSTKDATPVQVTKTSIDGGNFKGNNELSKGCNLLIIEDEKPWVEDRKGYSYGAVRRDVLVVEDGVAKNSVTYTYNNSHSSPKASAVHIGKPKTYRNLTFHRNAKSTKITYLFSISNAFDVNISNIAVTTPQDNELYGDAAIQIRNSAKVQMSDVSINGTYSQTHHYGYGINLENVAMFTGERLYARARWGVFGSNNVNGAVLRDCDINRFDIHCYGRDVRCYGCRFSDMYNQFSSVFGDVYFERCTFTNTIPVLMESSYNAYTPFDLTFKSCIFNLTASRNYLITLFGLEEAHNTRPELSRKALPNITIRNCTVNLADDVKKWYIVNTGKVAYKESLDYISRIEINGLKINGKVNYKIFSQKIKTTESLNLVTKGVKMIGK
ncbi:MAG: hypothetical protein MJ000_02515 [Bacteroidales bacterium]|nr:hypothetical protein [Bacteroidales bacterium]